jgi:hypothetical protein
MLYHFIYTHKFDVMYESHAVVEAANMDEATQKLLAAVGDLEGIKIKSSGENGNIVFIGSE